MQYEFVCKVLLLQVHGREIAVLWRFGVGVHGPDNVCWSRHYLRGSFSRSSLVLVSILVHSLHDSGLLCDSTVQEQISCGNVTRVLRKHIHILMPIGSLR